MKFVVPVVCSLLFALPAVSQAQTNDGFLRRDGTMYVLRNGQPRLMQHDVHLPNGNTVTHDGFVVAANGRRTELRNGSGCNLNGEATPIITQANRVVLQPVASSTSATRRTEYRQALPGWAQWVNGRGKGRYKKRKGKKHDD